MTFSPYSPLPLAEVRDLLGITRAMYRAALDTEPRDEASLQALERIGKTLRLVLAAADAPRGTIDHGDAWLRAERATRDLRGLVAGTAIEPLVDGTARRMARTRAVT